MAIEKVGIFGTRGRLGPWLLKALVESNKFDVTVILRQASANSLPAEYGTKVSTVVLPADFLEDEDGLAQKISGLEAVVMAIPADMIKEHHAMVNACIKAGVRRFIPADYGSVDSSDHVVTDLLPDVFGHKLKMRDALRDLAGKHPAFTWSSIVSGHFFDYGIEEPLQGFDIVKDPPTAMIFDDGNQTWSASTREGIGEALVTLLAEREAESANRMVYMQSFLVTQNQVLEALEKVSGKKFEVTRVESGGYIKEKKEEVDTGRGVDPTEELVGVLGMTRANWTQKKDFVNEAWGLKEKNLEEQVRKVYDAKMAAQKR